MNNQEYFNVGKIFAGFQNPLDRTGGAARYALHKSMEKGSPYLVMVQLKQKQGAERIEGEENFIEGFFSQDFVRQAISNPPPYNELLGNLAKQLIIFASNQDVQKKDQLINRGERLLMAMEEIGDALKEVVTETEIRQRKKELGDTAQVLSENSLDIPPFREVLSNLASKLAESAEKTGEVQGKEIFKQAERLLDHELYISKIFFGEALVEEIQGEKEKLKLLVPNLFQE